MSDNRFWFDQGFEAGVEYAIEAKRSWKPERLADGSIDAAAEMKRWERHLRKQAKMSSAEKANVSIPK